MKTLSSAAFFTSAIIVPREDLNVSSLASKGVNLCVYSIVYSKIFFWASIEASIDD